MNVITEGAKITATVLHKSKVYRAVAEKYEDRGYESYDVRIEVRERSGGAWSQLAVGMFQHGLLDCGAEASHVPEPVWERLHDALEALVQGESDEDDEVEDA